ncbi:MAG TPA: maltose alpha-D-glucosyltransferase [Lacipirellulaceae bacterium]|nr:maltose alpha-D-glucosyltransferase [Lacipirellulaceae bacterium]
MATIVDTAPRTASASALVAAPHVESSLWYKDAIIYQVHVRAFRDSNDDGIGDFPGLTERLDYIQDLGVTAIWLQPLFPSPLKDDGYDISDYMNVNPQYGTLDDLRQFLDEAHRRDLKVITELVMNHTSDQHEWFQRSRRSPAGSHWRNWYVWSDTPDKYREARIIFQDFESSNWSWDPVAGAYFWHRFYSHQPDLNFDNPEVRAAMFEALDFWLEMGVDGLRLDAVPYLFEREGTNCENLPETHAFLRDVRAHIDEKFSDRMMLAEANQWPEDAAAYFGDGDECHMNFHFPLMPRLFMAVEREDRWPIVDILEQTPELPLVCQWATFLRNHDELTLEMVTDEERDYMYRTYAVDAKARINLGIRRRLAPLMRNSRRKIELMNALLLSLPGTPILYYGDEIGMGDNYYLGDRNGVRTPMQWSADRNAGFSRANPQSLFLPVIIDPEYHYEFRNVEVQHGSQHSQLWWTRRILDLRKQYSAFGRGSFQALAPSNSKVFAFLRETDHETILVVANLSRLSQYAELDLSRFRGRTLTELFGQTAFPTISDKPYLFSLGPHGFFWFSISSGEEAAEHRPGTLPYFRASSGWHDLLTGRGRKVLGDALETYLQQQRWFAGKARTLQKVDLIDSFDLGGSTVEPAVRLLLVNANYSEGEPDAYVVPVAMLDEDAANDLQTMHPSSGIMRIELANEGRLVTLCEATWSDDLWQELLDTIARRRRIRAQHGSLAGTRTEAFTRLAPEPLGEMPQTVFGGEQSNTSAAFDERFILKLFRRVTPGINPDFEIGRLLTEHEPLSFVPQVAGAVEYQSNWSQPMSIAILDEFVPNVGDAWTYTLDELSRYFEHAQSLPPETLTNRAAVAESEPRTLNPEPSGLVQLADTEVPPLAQETIGGYLHSAELLGRRTGELHVALAHADGGAAFTPEPFTRLYQRGLYQSMRSQARTTLELLRATRHHLSEDTQARADQLLQHEHDLLYNFTKLLHGHIDARRIRCHGDLHLGQVLFTGKDFVIIDFEGEPERPVSERRIKASPLRDVAGMLRSFHYAAHAALRGQTSALIVQHAGAAMDEWAKFWSKWVSDTFLRSYLAAAEPGHFLPADRAQLETLLSAYLLEKALYELRYDLNNRPNWVDIPLDGILQLCGVSTEAAAESHPMAP